VSSQDYSAPYRQTHGNHCALSGILLCYAKIIYIAQPSLISSFSLSLSLLTAGPLRHLGSCFTGCTVLNSWVFLPARRHASEDIDYRPVSVCLSVWMKSVLCCLS